ncbi:MAG: hypothetical protein K6G26_02770 [Lachnospiraceae bacterium]|nr:hypothetical protein [Lachnospiraceae bacterium]
MELNINVKSVSGKKNKITTISVNYSKDEMSVREFLTETVNYCVNSYNERKENEEVLKALLPGEIEDKASQGKVSFGIIYGEKKADINKAVADAIEAFEDGIVAAFADDKRLEDINENIKLKDIQSVTFIKLVMLAGRMW